MIVLRAVLFALLAAIVVAVPGRAHAQTPPSDAEIEQYAGLHRAAARGHVTEIERLLMGGANPNSRDAYGRTPLHVAAFRSDLAAVTALVRGGADPRAKEHLYYDILTIAAANDDVEMIGLALWLGADPRAITSPDDSTALITAARRGHDGAVRELIVAGAPLDHVSSIGWTALLESLIGGDGGPRYVATLRALVEAGAKVNFADWQGTTALRLARSREYAEMVEILEAAGAR